MTTSSIHCSGCDHHVPASATHCPQCGAEAPGDSPFNQTLVNALVRGPSRQTGERTEIVEPIDDRFTRARRRGLKVLVAIGLIAAVGGGIGVGSWLSAQIFDAPSTATAEAELETPPIETPRMQPSVWVAQLPDSFELVRGAEVIHIVSSVDGSRYETIRERGDAVQLRLDHVSGKTDGHFVARVAGEHHELLWTDGERDFRIMDVTPADAKALDSEPQILANLLADRLNADRPRPNS